MKNKRLLLWTGILGLVLVSCSHPKPVKLGTSSVERVMMAMTVEEKVQLIISGEAIPRLGIPKLPFIISWELTEYLELPALLSLTWNTELTEDVAKAIGYETLQHNEGVLITPRMNILRNPFADGTFKYYSEDPVISGQIAAAIVRGIQDNGMGGSLNDLSPIIDKQDIEYHVQLTPRALREIYLKPFEIAVRESTPWVVLSSNNYINGVSASQSSGLLRTILRDEWQFNGTVLGLWNDLAQIKAGNDLLTSREGVYEEILDAVNAGTLKITDINRSVLNILKTTVQTPQFKGNDFSYHPDLDSIQGIKHQVSTEGIVLLKNENQALPLTKEGNQIAIYGEHSSHIAAGLDSLGYNYSLNTDVIPSQSILNQQVRNANAALITIRRNFFETDEYELTLTKSELSMIQSVCRTYQSANKKVVVILDIDTPLETASWKNLPDAILLTCTTWERDGSAIADIISGRINPSGKLTFTFPEKYTDIPSAEDMINESAENNITYTEDIYVGYRYFDTFRKNVSYPFGFGLSYTTFKYSDATILQEGDNYEVTVTITNTGKYAGKEVVQLYVSAPINPDFPKPLKELKAFAKTKTLALGESEIVTMRVNQMDLTSFDESTSSWMAESGTYRFLIGSSSQDIKQMVSVEIPQSIEKKVANVLLPRQPVNILTP